MRITSITPMKDEALYLLEWVAYHRLIGVNDILVFSNDCTDGTDQMLERLDEMGVLRHYANPSMYTQKSRHHWQVIRYINTMKRLRRSDWVVSFDVDEFICVNVGEGRLIDLFNAVPDANMICMNQLHFGCRGMTEYSDGLQMRQFDYCWDYSGSYYYHFDKRGVKTITHQSSNPYRWHNHSPVFRGTNAANVYCVNGNGSRLVDQDFTKDIKSLLAPNYGFDLVQLNHYVLRSAQSFLFKIARGNATHPDFGGDFAYWRRYDHNDRKDTRIQRLASQVEAAREELLQDPELRRLHDAAVNNVNNKFEGLLKDENYKALWERVIVKMNKRPGKRLGPQPLGEHSSTQSESGA